MSDSPEYRGMSVATTSILLCESGSLRILWPSPPPEYVTQCRRLRTDVYCAGRLLRVRSRKAAPIYESGLLGILRPSRQLGRIAGPRCFRIEENAAGWLYIGAGVQASGRDDSQTPLHCDAGHRAAAVLAEHGSESLRIRHFVFAKQFLARGPFGSIRFENDVAGVTRA